MGKEIPENIPRTPDIGAPKPVEGEQQAPGQSFETFMNENAAGKGQELNSVTPFDLAQGQAQQMGEPTHATIQAQMNSTSGVLGDIQQQLQTKNLKLKQSQKYLLRNKLSDANSYIRSAAGKVGVDTGAAPSKLTRQSPIAKFLALVSDGQNQINNTQKQIVQMTKGGKQMSAGDYLLVQVKLSKAQQELEYTSVLLSKAVDDIKMLFNIQI